MTNWKGTHMKTKVGVVLLFAAMLGVQVARAADSTGEVTDMQSLRAAARTDKKALVSSVLKLNDAEAKKFWPAYDAYQRTVDMTNRRRVVALEGVLATDTPRSDLYARTFSNEIIAADEGEIKARRALYTRVMRALPAKKAARYLQLEEKIRAVQAYDAAGAIPLMK
jgi:hypothetical protein